ncbi:MAG: TRAP transporter large permease [Oscillospiraceae bacterium]
MSMTEMLLWIIVILLISIGEGAPVFAAIGFTAVVTMSLFSGTKFLGSFTTIAYSQGMNSNQLIVPLFILMAEFLTKGGIAEDIFFVLNKYMKKLKGGLALCTIVACTIFAALCGSSPATAASVGRIASKEMTKRGYDKGFAIGAIAGGGTLGIMIPPSVTFVLFGIVTETSIVKLLMAGLLPGIMLAVLMCLYIVIRAMLDPTLVGEEPRPGSKKARRLAAAAEAARLAREQSGETIAEMEAIAAEAKAKKYEEPKTTVLQDIKLALPALLLIVVVIGCMYTGVATPTESAGIGVIGALLIVILNRRLNKEMFLSALRNTTKTSTMQIFLAISGMCLSAVITRAGIATRLAELIVGYGLNRWVVMALLFALWYILGCLMSPGSMIVLTIPFVFETLLTLGFDPLWIGVVSTLCVEVGMITPPVGLNLFILKSSTDVGMGDIIKGALPYVGVLTLGLIILCFFPQIALWIPSRM